MSAPSPVIPDSQDGTPLSRLTSTNLRTAPLDNETVHPESATSETNEVAWCHNDARLSYLLVGEKKDEFERHPQNQKTKLVLQLKTCVGERRLQLHVVDPKDKRSETAVLNAKFGEVQVHINIYMLMHCIDLVVIKDRKTVRRWAFFLEVVTQDHCRDACKLWDQLLVFCDMMPDAYFRILNRPGKFEEPPYDFRKSTRDQRAEAAGGGEPGLIIPLDRFGITWEFGGFFSKHRARLEELRRNIRSARPGRPSSDDDDDDNAEPTARSRRGGRRGKGRKKGKGKAK